MSSAAGSLGPPPTFGEQSYWESRYSNRLQSPIDAPSHVAEWFCSLQRLLPLLPPFPAREQCPLLVAGCGESSSGPDLLSSGLVEHCVCVDFASNCIEHMQQRHSSEHHRLSFVHCDVANTGLTESSTCGVLDKACLDAVLCGPNSFERGRAVVAELARCMLPDAPLVCVSVGEPRDRLWLFESAGLSARVQFLPKSPDTSIGPQAPIWLTGNPMHMSELNSALGSNRLALNEVYYIYICEKPHFCEAPNQQ